jgi:hypothetical protein
MVAMIELMALFHIKGHFSATKGAPGIRLLSYIAALETMLKPGLVLNIKKQVTTAPGATLNLPHYHVCLLPQL